MIEVGSRPADCRIRGLTPRKLATGISNVVPTAKRFGFVGAADCIHYLGCDAGRVDGPWMISSENLLVARESGLAESKRFAQVAANQKQAG
jgi:hypothetical protein